MIILDTNIISELMRPSPDALVGAWLSRLGDTPLSTTTITISEIIYGVERLPAGNRKQQLLDNFQILIDPEDGLAIHPFDSDAAILCGGYRAEREARGDHAHPSDMMIAGIAGAHGASLATRNIKDFSGLPVQLINPFEAEN